MRKPSAALYTLGCKVNQYESEAIAEALKQRGVEIVPAGAAVAIVNTCTVTGESDRKCRQTIRRAVRENPDGAVLVTGCLAQVNPAEILAIPGVSMVCGNRKKMAVVECAMEFLAAQTPPARIQGTELSGAPFEAMRVQSSERTRAYMKIEDGCEGKCAYCIIPAARGAVRSKAPEEVLAEAAALLESGFREIVLTGIEVCAYGKDRPPADFLSLLEALDALPGLERLRLSSIDPAFLTSQRIRRLAALRHLAPHFHLSLQSGSSAVLAAMRRRYTAEQAAEVIATLREKIPEMQFTADIIVGFPSETEEEFQKTCDFLRDTGPLYVHIFPYSKRAGTPAASLPAQIPEPCKHARAAALSLLCRNLRRRQLEEFATSHREGLVLFEQGEGNKAVGHLANFIPVQIECGENLQGQFRQVDRLRVADDGAFDGLIGCLR